MTISPVSNSLPQADINTTRRIVITGATGNVGSKVVDLLLNEGYEPRLMVRDTDKTKARFGRKPDIVAGDFSDFKSMSTAFKGAETVLLITSGPSIPEYDGMAAAAAKREGVQHLVKLSSLDAEQQVGTGVWHAKGENAIRDSGVSFTFVRPSGFMSNAIWWASSIKEDGVLRSCTGNGRIAFIHPTDIASVITAVLLTPQHYRNVVLPITGPDAMTYAEMGEKIGLEIGRRVRFEEISEADARKQQLLWRAGPALLEARLSIFRAIREGRLNHVTDVVQRVLHRQPINFGTWVKENVSAFL